MEKSAKLWNQFTKISIIILIILFFMLVLEIYISLIILIILLVFIHFKYPHSKYPLLIIITQILIIFTQPSYIQNLKEMISEPHEVNIYISNIETINRSNFDLASLNKNLIVYISNFDNFSESFVVYPQENYPSGEYTIPLLSPYLGACLDCTFFSVILKNNGLEQLNDLKLNVKTPNNVFDYIYLDEGIFKEENKGLFFDGSSDVLVQTIKPSSAKNFIIRTPNFESISVLCNTESKINCNYYYFKVLHERLEPIPKTFIANPGADTEKVWYYPNETGMFSFNVNSGFQKIGTSETTCLMPGQCLE